MLSKLKYTIPLIVIILAGCATTEGYRKNVDQWEGQNIANLVKKWGLPDNIISLYDGHEVYVYQNTKLVYHSHYCTNNDCLPNLSTENCTTWFEINDKNKIDGISFRGKDCLAS